MGYDKEFYRLALAEKDRMRKAAQRKAEGNRQAAYQKLPRLDQIDRLLAEKGARLALSALGGGDLDGLREECRRLGAEKEQLLFSIGLSERAFQPAYACADCEDTGRRGNGLCACVHRLAKKLAYERLSSSLPLEESRFDNFSLDFYPDEGQPSPRKRMAGILEFCRQYAGSFDPRAESLLFFGNTGLGKTHLSLAIAGTALDKGFGVVYGSCQDLLGAVERERFGRAEGRALENALSCDLLLLDDLGTEFSTPFNLSVINNLINTRLLERRPTIISTNLSGGELEERYTPRVASRIIGNYARKEFLGPDVRQQKRMRQMQRRRERNG
ncbi:MAG: ATP-binding protein [Clostridiales bacterium]|nr:ATP-binding protein [Clostridiales bacterium]